jgi:tetratricopeptide (TPR) repeat protein
MLIVTEIKNLMYALFKAEIERVNRFWKSPILSILLLALVLALQPHPLAAQDTRPDALDAYNTGLDLEVRGRTDEASAQYREVIRICNEEIAANTANANTYAALTWTFYRQQKYNDVITAGEQGLKRGNDWRVIETMGEAYFYLDNYTASLRRLQQYVEALPQGSRTSVAYFFIGEIFRIQKKNLSADIAYTTAIHLEGGNMARWWLRLGEVREASGDYRYAMNAYEAALKLSPGYQQAIDGLERSKKLAG